MPVLVDANFIISFFIERNRSQRELSRELFEQAAAGQTSLLLAQLTVFETAYVLQSVYDQSPRETAVIIESLLQTPGSKVIDDVPWSRLITLWPDFVPHLTDAALASIAIEESCVVATFDKRFVRRLRKLEIEVWEPE